MHGDDSARGLFTVGSNLRKQINMGVNDQQRTGTLVGRIYCHCQGKSVGELELLFEVSLVADFGKLTM